jgi:hypothetical protein
MKLRNCYGKYTGIILTETWLHTEQGLVTCDQQINEAKSEIRQSRHLTQPTNPLALPPALMGNRIMTRTDFGSSQIVLEMLVY